MKTRCLIIDDEPLAIQLIEKHLSQLETFEVVATANNAIKALEILKSKEIDLLFCDIKMPMLTGLDLLKTLKNPPKTIITTAHREFALDGYELDILDYLLKPITFERFFKAIEKYLRINEKALLPTASSATFEEVLTVKSNNKFYKINVEDILYVESQKDYSKFWLKDRELTAKYKISDLETELTGKGFLRIHRSFLINQKKVVSYSATHVEVGSYEVPIGAGYRELVLRVLGGR
jgi:two-component system, LytTR family, response regulator